VDDCGHQTYRKVSYSPTTGKVTIVFENSVQVVMRLREAVRFGDQLVRLIRPIWEIDWELAAANLI
jgi:hypothetical protein